MSKDVAVGGVHHQGFGAEVLGGDEPMIEAETLKSIATQLMTSTSVSVDGKSIPVRPSSRQHLRTAAFTVGGHEYQAIEQNPEKPSRWGQLARSGHKVVQF